MNWWERDSHVRTYIDMIRESPSLLYLDELLDLIPKGSRILELGMGPGKDLDILSAYYRMTGSDVSEVFLNIYRKVHPDADLIRLDAVEMVFPEGHSSIEFDGIVSNKVLVHLNPEEMQQSLTRQMEHLRPGGILAHSLWLGEGDANFDGLYFHYWTSEALSPLLPDGIEVLSMKTYREEEDEDSLLMILKAGV